MTPKGFRLHLGIFGRRNVGKSSLLNALTRQQTSIVSELAGTTTDPVEKPMELSPIGPVQFIDTAGIDDGGAIGERRIQKTREVFDRTDIGIVVSDGAFSVFERQIVDELQQRDIPIIFAFNKSDLTEPTTAAVVELEERGIPFVRIAAIHGTGLVALRELLVRTVPDDFLSPPPIVSDLVPPGELIVLVVPIDKEAPKGRLILPQVQTIRDILDGDRCCVIVKDVQLKFVLDRLKTPPALVVTDSQAFAKVSAITPEDVPLTSFSILFARQKGDFASMVEGAKAIGSLHSGSRVLVAESCTHHPIDEDIGTVLIPNMLRKFVGGNLEIAHIRGHDFPKADLADWNLVIHCGACMVNRREILSRVLHCGEAGVPITNYGLAIAFMLGIFERAIRGVVLK